MFERYTELARRAIFFARFEASRFGSPQIETEYLLLGLLEENEPLQTLVSRDAVRAAVKKRNPSDLKISTSVDLPVTEECKRALSAAASESERLGHPEINGLHLVFGVLSEESFAAGLLREQGVQLETIRARLAEPK
jgi:ATP-dependent Clp protease ATP-binding subunit ClpC